MTQCYKKTAKNWNLELVQRTGNENGLVIILQEKKFDVLFLQETEIPNGYDLNLLNMKMFITREKLRNKTRISFYKPEQWFCCGQDF